MAALTGPALVVAALLVLAGAQKVTDPVMTVGALRDMGMPSSAILVRVGAASEVGLGVAAIVIGGPVWWLLVASSYALFAVFVLAALRAGTMIGSCGCFGRDDTPPHWSHVVVNLVLAGLATWIALRIERAPIDGLVEHPRVGGAVVVIAIVTLRLLYLTFVQLPRTLLATNSS